jgi:hypothetical protein
MNTETTTTTGSVIYNATYHFKSSPINGKAYDNLMKLKGEGAISDDDLQQIRDDSGKLIALKRKSLSVPFTVLDVASVVDVDTLTEKQVAHLQHLVNEAVKSANQKVVDDGKIDFLSWEQVLDADPAVRRAAVKVTNEMVKATTAVFGNFIADKIANPDAQQMLLDVASKKFSIASTKKFSTEILEFFQQIIGMFMDDLNEEELATHAPVLEVWAKALEDALKPQEEISVDMFKIG